MVYFDYCAWLFGKTAGLPKRLRAGLTSRIEAAAIDVLEALTDARYTRRPEPHLTRASLAVNRLRLLLRLAHSLRALDNRAYEHSAEALTDIGRMLGGWLRFESGDKERG